LYWAAALIAEQVLTVIVIVDLMPRMDHHPGWIPSKSDVLGTRDSALFGLDFDSVDSQMGTAEVSELWVLAQATVHTSSRCFEAGVCMTVGSDLETAAVQHHPRRARQSLTLWVKLTSSSCEAKASAAAVSV